MIRPLVSAAVGLALLGGCGDDVATGPGVSSTTTESAAPAIVEPSDDAPVATGCPPPYAPIASADQYSGSTERIPDVTGTDTFEEFDHRQRVDTDGDGQPDEIRPKRVYDDPAALDRSGGALVFERAGLVASLAPIGDLDRDGRDELAVGLYEDTLEGSAEPVEFYAVPGDTASGTHDPTDVGIRLSGPAVQIGDRDGDGIGELLVTADGLTQVLPGAKVAAVDAPGDARPVAPTFAAPGSPLGQADIGGDAPVIVVGEVLEGVEPAGVVHLVDEDGDRRFTTAPQPWVVNYMSAFATPEVRQADDAVYLVLAQSDRSAARAYLWRVDDPCGSAAG